MSETQVAKPRLEFGQLHECGQCHRRKAEPGSRNCPDCVVIGRLVGRYGHELERMFHRWVNDQRLPAPGPFMADDDDFLSFKTRDELMNAYSGWLG